MNKTELSIGLVGWVLGVLTAFMVIMCGGSDGEAVLGYLMVSLNVYTVGLLYAYFGPPMADKRVLRVLGGGRRV